MIFHSFENLKKCESDSKCWKTSTKNKDGGAIQFVSFGLLQFEDKVQPKICNFQELAWYLPENGNE